jgi:hypothetical protein
MLLQEEQHNGGSFVLNNGFADELNHPNLFSIKAAKLMAPTS